MSNENTSKRRQARRKQSGEDFTPEFLIKQMADKLIELSPNEFKDPAKTDCDPSCGNGNFLAHVVEMKLKAGHSPLQALNTTYGCDIQKDNIQECRERLLNIIKKHEYKITFDMAKAVVRNIVWTPLCHFPNGSLDYNFNFLSPDNRVVQNLLDVINGTRESNEEMVEEIEEPNLFTQCMQDTPTKVATTLAGDTPTKPKPEPKAEEPKNNNN